MVGSTFTCTFFKLLFNHFCFPIDIQTDDEKAGPIAEFINFMSSLETKSVGRGPSHSFTTVWRKAQGYYYFDKIFENKLIFDFLHDYVISLLIH